MLGACGGLRILAISPFVVRYAELTATAREYLRVMLYINCVYIFGPALNTTLVCGIFRSGGDSKFGLKCDVIDMWCYAIPLFLAAFVLKLPVIAVPLNAIPLTRACLIPRGLCDLKLPVLAVYALLCTDEFVKMPFIFWHYRKGTWLKNITRERAVDCEQENKPA